MIDSGEETALVYNDLQRAILKAIVRKDRIIAARCGWGSGKTSALVFALLFISKIRPGTSSLLVTDTNGRYNSVLMPEIEKWLVPFGWTYSHTLRQWIDTENGSKVYCRSYFRPGTRDATHNALEGLNITSGVCLIDECQTLNSEVANKAFGRLRSGPSPIMILVGLPVLDAWWCKLAEKSGNVPLLFTSYVNQKNLSKAWFDATELLPPAEREAMVMNRPQLPDGLVYSEFNYERHVIDDFEYSPEMSGRLAIDWGFRKPSVLVIVYDESREASIIVHEINPAEVTIEELNRMILNVAYPRDLALPGDKRIMLDSAVADKAGRARSDHSGLSAFSLMRRHPKAGGVGLPIRSTTDPIRTDILNGVQRLKRAFHNNRYLLTREVWTAGERSAGNSLRKSLMSYSWNKDEKPVKDGREDPLDALRYDCVVHYWTESLRKYSGSGSSSARRKIRPKRRKKSF